MAAEKEQLDQDYDYYDEAYDDDEDGARGPIRLVVLAIVVAAFFGVGWIAYKQGIQEGKSNVPILKAETGTLKETPAEPLPAPGGSREIFERSSGTAASQPEQLLPPPETPIERAPAAPAPGPAPAEATAPAVIKPTEPLVAAAPPPEPRTAPIEESASAPAAAAPAAISEGAYLVQVAAARSDSEATQIWSKLQAKNTDLLSAYQSDVVNVELPGKGTFHRVRFGPFASRDDAGRVCDALKSRKQDCIVVKK